MFADDKSIENMQQLFIEFKKYLELHTRRSGSVSSVVYAGLYLSSAGRRANDEFCTYHVLPYPTHRSACPIPQKAHYWSDSKTYRRIILRQLIRNIHG